MLKTEGGHTGVRQTPVKPVGPDARPVLGAEGRMPPVLFWGGRAFPDFRQVVLGGRGGPRSIEKNELKRHSNRCTTNCK